MIERFFVLILNFYNFVLINDIWSCNWISKNWRRSGRIGMEVGKNLEESSNFFWRVVGFVEKLERKIIFWWIFLFVEMMILVIIYFLEGFCLFLCMLLFVMVIFLCLDFVIGWIVVLIVYCFLYICLFNEGMCLIWFGVVLIW